MADALTDPADREQQDRCGDRHENIVEPGEKAKLLLVRNSARALALDISAQRARRLLGDHAGRNSVVQLLLTIHARSPTYPAQISSCCIIVSIQHGSYGMTGSCMDTAERRVS